MIRLHHEHIVVCFSAEPPKQVWQWAVHMPDGRKLRHREHPFFSDCVPDSFVQRLQGLEFTFEDEENATLNEARTRVRQALDIESDFELFAKSPHYAEQSDRLAIAMRAGVLGAFDDFVMFHHRLARHASRQLVRWVQMEPEDAEQIAMIGLIEAARRFKPELGYQFSTYAGYWLKQICRRECARIGLPIHIPMHVFWPCYGLQFEFQRLVAAHGPKRAESRFGELLKQRSISPLQWESYQRSCEVIRLTDATAAEYRELRGNTESGVNPEERGVLLETQAIVRDALEQLEKRDTNILSLRYGIECKEHTLEEVAQQHGVTRERIRQIQARAEDRLKWFLPKSECESLSPIDAANTGDELEAAHVEPDLTDSTLEYEITVGNFGSSVSPESEAP